MLFDQTIVTFKNETTQRNVIVKKNNQNIDKKILITKTIAQIQIITLKKATKG